MRSQPILLFSVLSFAVAGSPFQLAESTESENLSVMPTEIEAIRASPRLADAKLE